MQSPPSERVVIDLDWAQVKRRPDTFLIRSAVLENRRAPERWPCADHAAAEPKAGRSPFLDFLVVRARPAKNGALVLRTHRAALDRPADEHCAPERVGETIPEKVSERRSGKNYLSRQAVLIGASYGGGRHFGDDRLPWSGVTSEATGCRRRLNSPGKHRTLAQSPNDRGGTGVCLGASALRSRDGARADVRLARQSLN